VLRLLRSRIVHGLAVRAMPVRDLFGLLVGELRTIEVPPFVAVLAVDAARGRVLSAVGTWPLGARVAFHVSVL